MFAISTAIAVCACWLVACSPRATPAQNLRVQAGATLAAATPAARVPVHVLTKEQAGSLTVAEQGDFIEIRLDEQTSAGGRWWLERQTGDARIEVQGPAVLVEGTTGSKRVFRVFHLRALGVGALELVFVLRTPAQASRPQQAVTFRLVVR